MGTTHGYLYEQAMTTCASTRKRWAKVFYLISIKVLVLKFSMKSITTSFLQLIYEF